MDAAAIRPEPPALTLMEALRGNGLELVHCQPRDRTRTHGPDGAALHDGLTRAQLGWEDRPHPDAGWESASIHPPRRAWTALSRPNPGFRDLGCIAGRERFAAFADGLFQFTRPVGDVQVCVNRLRDVEARDRGADWAHHLVEEMGDGTLRLDARNRPILRKAATSDVLDRAGIRAVLRDVAAVLHVQPGFADLSRVSLRSGGRPHRETRMRVTAFGYVVGGRDEVPDAATLELLAELAEAIGLEGWRASFWGSRPWRVSDVGVAPEEIALDVAPQPASAALRAAARSKALAAVPRARARLRAAIADANRARDLAEPVP